MKKTFITLLALAGVASGVEYTYKTDLVGTLDNNIAHGFTLNLDEASNIIPADDLTPETLGGYYYLTEFTYTARTGSHTSLSSGSFSLLVLDSTRKIIGWSDNSHENGYGVDYTFKFSNVGINTGDTYTLAAVSSNVLNVAQQGMYYHGGTGSNVSVDQDGSIITGGLRTIGVRVDLHWDNKNTPNVNENIDTTGANLVMSSELTSEVTNQGAVYTSVKLIPEPTTATLSLLALAGLAARRRRR